LHRPFAFNLKIHSLFILNFEFKYRRNFKFKK